MIYTYDICTIVEFFFKSNNEGQKAHSKLNEWLVQKAEVWRHFSGIADSEETGAEMV